MEKREHALDWLVGLLPTLLVAFIGYRWRVAALLLLAVGGYLAATLLREWLLHAVRETALIPRALLAGALLVLLLPGNAPFWVAALGGGMMAAAQWIPARAGKVSLPYVHPVALTYLLLRWWLPEAVAAGYTLPLQWAGMDALSSATPLAALQGSATVHSTWQLFFGVRTGAMGELCVAAVLLGAAYLLLRRRLRLIAPACMLAVVSLGSLIGWGSPLYGLLAGAPVLVALLLADADGMPHDYADQITAGVTAAVVTLLLRAVGGWSDGTAVGLLLAFAAVYLRPHAWRLLRRIPLKSVLRDIFVKNKNNG